LIPATFPLATTSTAESVPGWERMKADLLCFLEVFLTAMVGAGVHHGEGGVGNVVVEDILVSPGPVATLDIADCLQLSVREFHCEGCVVAVLAGVLVRDDVAGLRPSMNPGESVLARR
jgi:hypothetical protein